MDIFIERLNREEKSRADWTNPYILEQVNREEKKDQSFSFQSTSLIKSLWSKTMLEEEKNARSIISKYLISSKLTSGAAKLWTSN